MNQKINSYFKKQEIIRNPFALFFRKKEIRDFLKLNLKLSNKKVLEVGSGSGIYTKIFMNQPIEHLVCVDVHNLSCMDLVNERMTFLPINIFNLPKSELFDVIICLGTSEFISNHIHLLSSLLERLENNGIIVVSCPKDKSIFTKIYFLFHAFQNNFNLCLSFKTAIDYILGVKKFKLELTLHSFGYMNEIYILKKGES
jgi:2-polyprenyl-3-methyl-5-hydroxy-6-metoxy-1,4-benzoquinol methylase